MYQDDLKTGPWKTYHINGKIWSTGTWKRGKKIKVWRTFDEDGNLRTLKSFTEEGIRTGVWNFYNPEGSLTKSQIWEDGELTEKISYD